MRGNVLSVLSLPTPMENDMAVDPSRPRARWALIYVLDNP